MAIGNDIAFFQIKVELFVDEIRLDVEDYLDDRKMFVLFLKKRKYRFFARTI